MNLDMAKATGNATRAAKDAKDPPNPKGQKATTRSTKPVPPPAAPAAQPTPPTASPHDHPGDRSDAPASSPPSSAFQNTIGEVRQKGFEQMGVEEVPADRNTTRTLTDDESAKILAKCLIGTALLYVPALNPEWKVRAPGRP
jgi:hypothetical protein